MHLHEAQRPPTRVGRYEAPATVADALALLEAGGGTARLVAGGTDLLVELDRGDHEGIGTLVDVGRIEGLDAISDDGRALRLGANVTHNQVVADGRCVEHALPLAQACLEVGSPQLRNRATVTGNIVTASPANDTISALLALGASVEIASAAGPRLVAVADFITGFRRTQLAPDELVTAVVVPKLAADQRGLFVKLGLRRAQAISVVHLAVVVTIADDGTIADTAMALGSVAPTVVLVDDLAATLRGRPLDRPTIAEAVEVAVAAADPIDDLRATADYRRNALAVMAERALLALAGDRQRMRWPTDPPLLWGPAFDGRFPTGPERSLSVGAGDSVTAGVNGVSVTAPARPEANLLDWLRAAGATGVKEGCAEGECGACTVDLDGAAVMSCLVPAPRAAGATIVTVEGLAPGPTDDAHRLHPVQQAFVDTAAVQCGYCTPGLVMACAKLLEEVPTPDRDQIRAALAGNLCRCTGYAAIEAAVAAASGGARR